MIRGTDTKLNLGNEWNCANGVWILFSSPPSFLPRMSHSSCGCLLLFSPIFQWSVFSYSVDMKLRHVTCFGLWLMGRSNGMLVLKLGLTRHQFFSCFVLLSWGSYGSKEDKRCMEQTKSQLAAAKVNGAQIRSSNPTSSADRWINDYHFKLLSFRVICSIIVELVNWF